MLEIKWYGRGGQGVVTASQLLAEVLMKEGMYALAIPMFGAERRGAPVIAYNRVSNKPVRRRGAVKEPDILVIMDYKLSNIPGLSKGLKRGGLILVNAPSPPPGLEESGFKVASVDATEIAVRYGLELGGLAIVSTPMLGALLKVSDLASFRSLEEIIESHWGGESAWRNIKCAREAFNEVRCSWREGE